MSRRVQYAALPYRVRQDGAVQIRLITSRETRRWVIPKGWPMKGLSPSKAAAREAYEEAGLLGSMSRKPLGIYSYEKRLSVRSVLCDVTVFPLKVKRKLQNWPERSQRVGFWFTIESAAFAVNEEELKLLILDFGDLMARKWEDKKKPKAKEKVKEQMSDLSAKDAGKDGASDDDGDVKTSGEKAAAEPGKPPMPTDGTDAVLPEAGGQAGVPAQQNLDAGTKERRSDAETAKVKASAKAGKSGARAEKIV